MSLKLVVLIKQVLANAEGRMDPEKGVLIRKGEPHKLNQFDYAALEMANQIKGMIPGTRVCCLTMGPDEAQEILIEGLSLGADQAFHLSDRCFSGADALATAFTLSQGIKKMGDVDLVICGKQSSDGDTGQVGASVAAFLDQSFLGNVSHLETVTADKIRLTQQLSSSQEVCYGFPLVISVEPDSYPQRVPTLPARLQAKKKTVTQWQLTDLPNQDRQLYGAKGSPTRVTKIYSTVLGKNTDLIRGTVADQVKLVRQLLVESRVIL